MARPRKFDRERVIESSMRQFWERGYHETSIPDLVAATGVQPGSLYNEFPGGKHALFLHSLEHYSKLVVPQKMGALEQATSSVREIRAYFDGLVHDLSSPEGRIGCLMVNSAMELATTDTEIAQIVRRHMARLEKGITQALQNAKKRGEVPTKLVPAAKAAQPMTTAMGLIVVGKTNPGPKLLKGIVKAAFSDLQ